MTAESDVDIVVVRRSEASGAGEERLAAAAERITALADNGTRIIDIDEADLAAPEYGPILDEIHGSWRGLAQ